MGNRDCHFTCTLGQALYHPRSKAANVPGFLQAQAEQHGQKLAVGFPGQGGQADSLTFIELNEQTKDAARGLVDTVPKLRQSLGQGHTAALLAHSNVTFLRNWLALIRLGFSVLLLAPQLDDRSIQHLCSEREVRYLFHDGDHMERAESLRALSPVHIQTSSLLWGGKVDPEVESQLGPNGKVSPVPFLHHSSGTSSGKPKAIPQCDAAAFAALPAIATSSDGATFSSTPLYHGGVADCFRAWTSGQMIWLFPGGEKPITAQNVLECLSVAKEATSKGSSPPVRYFSSVPYVLRDLAATDEGMGVLGQMDMVGVGGAAFPPSLGRHLVEQDIRLVSRYGSSECGFLLSSFREFADDMDWDFLRSHTGAEYLSFEPQQNGLFELVVKPGWPHMAKTNREDGSYATADLFEKHPTKANAWRYHSRADAQYTLINGKKFDPEPLESAIISRCPASLLQDVFVFGDGKDYPGALLFAGKTQDASCDTLLEEVWPTINEINAENMSHLRLSKGMLRVIFHQDKSLPPLEKSSKGTILRGRALEQYHDQISEACTSGSDLSLDGYYSINSQSDQILAITQLVKDATSKSLAPDDDFFEQGVDSAACIQIKNAIQKLITRSQEWYNESGASDSQEKPSQKPINGDTAEQWFQGVGELPSNVLYDCGTIRGLVGHLFGHKRLDVTDDLDMMKELGVKYSRFDAIRCPVTVSQKLTSSGLVVVLTGATGALGTHLLDTLRENPDVGRVYCLLRASDTFVAYERASKALNSKAKQGLERADVRDEKVFCVPCNLAQPDLGLDNDLLQTLRSTVDCIIHAAWAVNFTLKLKSFEFHLAGVQNLLNLGLSAAQAQPASKPNEERSGRHVQFLFCSSVASVSSFTGHPVAEKLSREASDASTLGYSRSKWVAETICNSASEAAAANGVSLDVKILRIGQLCGDTRHGIWNKTEAWPLLLSTYDLVGCLPDLPGEKLSWLPLDDAAQAVLEIALGTSVKSKPRDEAEIYHVVNPHPTPTWKEMLQWLQELDGGHVEVVEPAVWLDKLEKGLVGDYTSHPSRKLLGLWKESFQTQSAERQSAPVFEVTRASKLSATMRSVKPLSRGQVETMWGWIRQAIPTGTTGGEA